MHNNLKYLPNLVTSLRLICALAMLTLVIGQGDHGAAWFLPLFVTAGISDMLDGMLARRFNWCTEYGARLDSISDQALYLSTSVFFITVAPQALAMSAPLLIAGGLTQALHLILSCKRHKQFPAYHTTFSRGSAYLIFFAVIAFWLLHWPLAFNLIGAFWLTSNIEGVLITAILRQPASNLRGIPTALSLTGQKFGTQIFFV